MSLNEKEANSIELSPNITAEINEKGELIGIEILDASSYIRDSILESSQAKILELKKSGLKCNIYDEKRYQQS